MLSNGKGIFAADASPKTIGKRSQSLGINLDNEDQRRRYREVILTAPDLEKYIGGVILHDETIRQSTATGQSFVDVLQAKGILPGIKVDQGLVEMSFGSLEKVSQGLEQLDQRLDDYVQLGAKFTKWRIVVTIGQGIPTVENIDSNAKTLASFALFSQRRGLVPIVEPEVLMDGDHTIDRCLDVTRLVGKKVFQQLLMHEVDLSAMLYKPNMVVAGKDSPSQPTEHEVAQKTVDVMQEIVPPKVPGVAFLSGGQEALLATRRLNEIARLAGASRRFSFSFERALEGPAMKVWNNKDENVSAARKVLLHRAKCNSLASLGQYSLEVENEV